MFGELEALLSLICSVLALFSTGYFWLVRNNQERQNLTIQTLTPLRGSVVMVQEDAFPYQHLVCHEGQYWARFNCQLVVTNNSVLPNTILGIRAWLAAPDGSWLITHARISSPGQLPVSLAPSDTTSIELTLYLPVNERGGDREQRISCAMKSIHAERRLRVRVQTLNHHKFQFDLAARPQATDPLMRAA